MGNDTAKQLLSAISIEHEIAIDPAYADIVYVVRLMLGGREFERRAYIPAYQLGPFTPDHDLARALEEIAGELRR